MTESSPLTRLPHAIERIERVEREGVMILILTDRPILYSSSVLLIVHVLIVETG